MNKKLLIEGMHCENCVKGLKNVLTEDLNGVNVVDISLEGKYALIDVDEKITDEELKSAVEELGFVLEKIDNV